MQTLKKIADEHDILSIYLFGSQSEAGLRYLEGEAVIPETHSDLDVALAFEKPPADVIKQYGMLYKEFSVEKEIMEAIEDGYIEFEYSPNS